MPAKNNPAKKKGSTIRLLVLDVLKPHQPNIVDFGKTLALANGIENIDVSVYAVDERTETVKVVLEGNSLDFDTIRKTIEESGAVVHSIDKICIGKSICSHMLHELPHGFKHF